VKAARSNGQSPACEKNHRFLKVSYEFYVQKFAFLEAGMFFTLIGRQWFNLSSGAL
jgi:hypothetical protein